MTNANLLPIAVVVEPRPTLADTVADALRRRGYEVLVASTHAGGAKALLADAKVDILVAAVPAPDEDRSGAHLAVARIRNSSMRTVVMLSDPGENATDAPLDAIRLVKPFTLDQLEDALNRADAFMRD